MKCKICELHGHELICDACSPAAGLWKSGMGRKSCAQFLADHYEDGLKKVWGVKYFSVTQLAELGQSLQYAIRQGRADRERLLEWTNFYRKMAGLRALEAPTYVRFGKYRKITCYMCGEPVFKMKVHRRPTCSDRCRQALFRLGAEGSSSAKQQ